MVGCHQRIFDAKSTSLAQLRQPGGYRLEPASRSLLVVRLSQVRKARRFADNEPAQLQHLWA